MVEAKQLQHSQADQRIQNRNAVLPQSALSEGSLRQLLAEAGERGAALHYYIASLAANDLVCDMRALY